MRFIYCLLALIILCSIYFYYINLNKEQFSDFKIDESKILHEDSIRFYKTKPYNSARVAFIIRDREYLMNNKEQIFKFYNFDKKLIDYFNTNFDSKIEPNDPSDKLKNNSSPDLAQDNSSILDQIRDTTKKEVGFGFDKGTNTSKIYIAQHTTIRALKIKNGTEINSIYTLDPDFTLAKLNKFLGDNKGDKINKELNKITVDPNNEIENLEKNSSLLLQVVGKEKFDEFKRTIYDHNSKNEKQQLSIDGLNCYLRYDGNTFIGYHLDLYDFNLKIGENKDIVKNILKNVGYNTDGIDKWIEENKNNIMAWLSFTKINNEDNVSIYYRNPSNWSNV